MARFIIIFMTIMVTLFTVEMLQPVQTAIIQPFTGWLAQASAALILPFDTDVTVSGRVIMDTVSGHAVSIEAGCNGVEASIVLIAAVLAFPAPWRARALAIAGGLVAIQVLNLGRIITLFYLLQWNYEVFSFGHLYLWPTLIMIDVLLVFMLYLYLLGKQAEAGSVA